MRKRVEGLAALAQDVLRQKAAGGAVFAFRGKRGDRLKLLHWDGKARYLDNNFIERLWRFLKYECVYLHAWETGSQAKAGVGRWITFYNQLRAHAAHGGLPPAVVYLNATETDQQVQAVA